MRPAPNCAITASVSCPAHAGTGQVVPASAAITTTSSKGRRLPGRYSGDWGQIGREKKSLRPEIALQGRLGHVAAKATVRASAPEPSWFPLGIVKCTVPITHVSAWVGDTTCHVGSEGFAAIVVALDSRAKSRLRKDLADLLRGHRVIPLPHVR